MRENNTTVREWVYSVVKEYGPVLAVCFLLLFSVVAAGGLYTQPLGDNGYSSATAQSSGYVYTATNDNIAYKIDPSDMSVVGTETVADSSRAVTISPDNVYVGDNSGRVTKITKDSFTQDSFVNVGYEISGAFYHEGSVYTHGYSGQISKVNVGDMTVETTISGGTGRTHGSDSFDLHNGNIYISEEIGVSNGIEVKKLDPSTDSITDSFTINGRPPREPRGITANENGIFVSAYEEASTSNAIYKFDLDLTSYSKDIVTADRSPGSIRTLDNGNIRFVTVSGIFEYDPSLTQLNVYSVASGSSDGPRMALDSGGNTYVASGGGSSITQYDTGFSQTGSVSVSGSINADVITERQVIPPKTPFDPNLEIETRSYLPHNSSSPYTVYYTNPETGEVTNVNDDSGLTVNSSNTSVFTLDTTANEVVATNDTSINQREQFTAEYEGLQAQENVTVANQTVENLPILPGITRVGAVYSDSNIALILVGTLLGVVATRVASAFAGLGAIQLTLVAGWFVDLVSLGVVIVSLFAALFIGLNMAANIDYTVGG